MSRTPSIEELAERGEVDVESVDLAVARGWADQEESLLRAQYPDGFPEDWDAEFKRLGSNEGLVGQLRRWAYAKHLMRVRASKLVGPTSEEATEAARQLMRREPVVVELAGHRVEVTGRSYSALLLIAQHDLRLKSLREDLNEVLTQTAALIAARKKAGRWKLSVREGIRTALEELHALHADLIVEIERHRGSLYANALTSHGGPATDPARDTPPRWWRQMTEEDDARLLLALWEAGPQRIQKLGPPPAASSKSEPKENFGYATLFRSLEPQMHVQPAELYNTDLGKVHAAARAFVPDYGSDRDA